MMIETTKTIYHIYFVYQGYNYHDYMGTKQLVYATRKINWIKVSLKISFGAVCVSFDDPENIICTIPTHAATRSCMQRSDTHTALFGAVCGVRVRIYSSDMSCMRTELYAYLQRLSVICSNEDNVLSDELPSGNGRQVSMGLLFVIFLFNSELNKIVKATATLRRPQNCTSYGLRTETARKWEFRLRTIAVSSSHLIYATTSQMEIAFSNVKLLLEPVN